MLNKVGRLGRHGRRQCILDDADDLWESLR